MDGSVAHISSFSVIVDVCNFLLCWNLCSYLCYWICSCHRL